MPAGGAGGLFLCLQKFSKRIFLSVEAVGRRGLCGADVCLCLPSGLGSGRLFFMAPEIVFGKKDKCRGCLGSLVSSKSGAGVRERMRLKILQVFGGVEPLSACRPDRALLVSAGFGRPFFMPPENFREKKTSV